jgi:hypothetical protein
VGDRRANAVGPVRLTCEPRGLRIELFGVGRFSAGFAFATLADAVSFVVPYRAVRGMVRDGRSLMLSLDPQTAAPYSRFALVRFSKEPMETLMRAFRARSLAGLASYLFPLPIAGAVAYALHRRELAGPVGIAAVAVIVAVLAFRLLRMVVGWVSWGGPLSDRLRDGFENAISERLGLTPAPGLSPKPKPEPVTAEPAQPAQALGAVFRPVAFAVVGTLAIAAAGVAVLTVREYGVADRVVLPVEDARTGVTRPVPALVRAGVAAASTKHPSCQCSQVDSTLWREGLPQLSLLVNPIHGQLDVVWLERDKRYPIRYPEGSDPNAELNLAVVNNSRATFKTLDLVMTFAFTDEHGKRRNLRERGLHWPARLGPGESVRWHVEAPGTELKIETRHDAKLADVGVAPVEAFYPLGKATIPIVRLHGAMMLAKLRDGRAPTLAAAAGKLFPAGERVREELMRTLGPLSVCDVSPRKGGFSACVFNGTDELKRSMTLTTTDGDGKTATHTVTDFFHPKEGLKVAVPMAVEGRTISVSAP